MAIFTSLASKAIFILGDLNADYPAFKRIVEDAEYSKEPEIQELHLILTGNSGITSLQQLKKMSETLHPQMFLHYAGGNTVYDNWNELSAPAGTHIEIAERVYRHGSGSLFSVNGHIIMFIGRCETLKGERTQNYNSKQEILSHNEIEEIQKNLFHCPHILISPLPPLNVLKDHTKNLFENDIRKHYLKNPNVAILDSLVFKKPPILWIHSCPRCLPPYFDSKGTQHIFLNGISYSSSSIVYLYNGDILYNN